MVMESKTENVIKKIRSWYYILRTQSHNKELVIPEGIRYSVRTDESSEDEFGDEVKRSKPQKQRPWVREEMVLLVAEYFRTRDLSPKEKRESIEMISKVLRQRAINNGEKISDTFRNINGIQMQTACIMKYDPAVMRTKDNVGLSGGGKLMVEIVKEYIENGDKIKSEAYTTVMTYVKEAL